MLPALVLSLSGCATVWARGIVRDQEGQPIAGATVTLSPAGSTSASSSGVSEHNGCFNILSSAKKDQTRFVLTVGASGFKELSASFTRKERLTATVTLLAESQPGDSSLTRVPESEERRVYEEACIPPPVPGAMSLGVR